MTTRSLGVPPRGGRARRSALADERQVPEHPWDLASPTLVVDGSSAAGDLARQLDRRSGAVEEDRLVVVRDGLSGRAGTLPVRRVTDALSTGRALQRRRAARRPVRDLADFPALVLPHDVDLDTALGAVLGRPQEVRYDDVVLHRRTATTEGWRRLGAARLLEATTRWQTWRATRDDLTGLLVRSAFLDQVRAAATGGDRLAVVFVDLDRLKTVNDTHGHAAGDELIRAVAQRLRRAARAGDAVARLGGDEFALSCRVSCSAGSVEARAVAERLLRAVREVTAQLLTGDDAAPRGRAERAPGASVGVAVSGPLDGGLDAEHLLREADAAMYAAKAAGGDGVVLRAVTAPGPAPHRRPLLVPVPPTAVPPTAVPAGD